MKIIGSKKRFLNYSHYPSKKATIKLLVIAGLTRNDGVEHFQGK